MCVLQARREITYRLKHKSVGSSIKKKLKCQPTRQLTSSLRRAATIKACCCATELTTDVGTLPLMSDCTRYVTSVDGPVEPST